MTGATIEKAGVPGRKQSLSGLPRFPDDAPASGYAKSRPKRQSFSGGTRM